MQEELLSFDDLPYVEPEAPAPRLDKSWTPLAQLILETIEDDSGALKDWVEKVVPFLLSELSLLNAKGMSLIAAEGFVSASLSEESRRKALHTLVHMPDQSLAVHILNAALGGWTTVRLAGLDDEQQRLYLASVTMHDLNKMVGQDVRLESGHADDYNMAFEQWADRLRLWEFVDRRYAPDIAFLAHNAEAKRGENRTLANFPGIHLEPAELEELSEFVRLADLLASAATRPDDIVRMGMNNKIPDLIRRIFQGRYELRYHRTMDNRGLLTQLIHNGVLSEVMNYKWIPFLYFPDGVTYLAPTNLEEPDLSVVPKVVRKQLVEATQNRLGELVKRDNFGIGYDKKLTELLDPVAAGDTIIRRTMVLISDSKPPVTEARKAKTQLKDGAGVTLELDYPESQSADRLAECMRCLCNVLQDYYGKDVTEHGTALIKALGMEKHLTPWESIDPKGGIAYGWYYIGGHYVTENPGMDPDELPKRMGAAYASVLRDLGEVKRKPPFGFLEDYIPRILTVGGATQSWDFQGELERYTKNKAPRSSTHICALCNSPFDNEAGFSSYSNKTVVGSRIKRRVQSQRYICEPCQAESILRRFAFGRAINPSDKTKYLHLYPTYFFTPISGRAMLKAYSQLQSITFGEIAQPLQQADYDVSALVHDDVFKIFEPTNPKRWLNQVDYNPNEMHGYYLLGMPYLGKKPSATESWAMPALAALFVPLVLGVKVVVSELALPIYTSGADFPETVVLDSPHQYWHHFMRKTRFRLDEIEDSILAAVAVYGITSDAYRDSRGFPIWNQLGSVAAKVGSDPLSVFGYADRITSQIGRGRNTVLTTDGLTPQMAKMLICYQDFVASYYESLRLGGENKMGMIRELVDRYAVFYRATKRSAHARLRPVSLAAEVVLKSPVELDRESLQLQTEGRLLELLDGVRNNMIDGWIPAGAYKDDERAPLVSEFARYFLDEVFEDYCHGDLSILRQRINLIKKGCEAYYVQSYSFKKDDSKEEMP